MKSNIHSQSTIPQESKRSSCKKKDTPDNSLQEGYLMIVLQNTQYDEANRTTNATQNNSTF